MKHIRNPFVEKESSLFIVQTPFQALCAINAIRQLKIDDYVLSLHLHPKALNRNKQTIELVERYGLNYDLAKTESIGLSKLLGLLFKQKGIFYRVFLGTHLYHDGYYYSLMKLHNGGDIVLLDDGVATVTLLEEKYKVTGIAKVYRAWYSFIAALRDIRLNNVLTVYKDIINPKWNIAINNISTLRQAELQSVNNSIFFIGTDSSVLIEQRNVVESDFRKMLFSVLKQIRDNNPQDKVIYIPHGSDKATFTKEYCEELGVDYKPLDINVENYILSLNIIPHIVYGFTSSALYNLKMIFPESEVNNVVTRVLSDKLPNIISISDYYEKEGINTINV